MLFEVFDDDEDGEADFIGKSEIFLADIMTSPKFTIMSTLVFN